MTGLMVVLFNKMNPVGGVSLWESTKNLVLNILS